jgi:hypothetical protein
MTLGELPFLFKWKSIENHTADMKLVNLKWAQNEKSQEFATYDLLCSYDEFFRTCQLTFVEKLTEEEKKELQSFENEICECFYDASIDQWVPDKIRPDRKLPNALFVVNQIVMNIKENLTLQEMISDVEAALK